MRSRVVILALTFLSLLPVLPGILLAKEDPRHVQIQAAQADALASLLDQVRVARLTPELTVGEFLDRTRGEERLRREVAQNLELIGATRWPNPGTCQVQMEIPAERVIGALVSIARDEAARSPIPPEVMEKRLAAVWNGRVLAAAGTSATPEAVAKMRPGPEHPLWLNVPEDDRRAAVKAAQRNAARRTMEGLGDISLPGGKNLADALEVPAVRDAIQNWVATRPVTNIEFRDNGEVRLTVSAPGEDLWAVLQDALGRQNEIPPPRDEAEWRRLHDQVVGRTRSQVGGQSALTTERSPGTLTRPTARTVLPQQPPRWADDQLDAEGKAGGGGGRLRVARAAEADAMRDLRTQIKSLPLGDGRTLGDAAASDLEVAAAIERSLLRARTFNAEWGANGDSVAIHVALDLRHVWQELPHR